MHRRYVEIPCSADIVYDPLYKRQFAWNPKPFAWSLTFAHGERIGQRRIQLRTTGVQKYHHNHGPKFLNVVIVQGTLDGLQTDIDSHVGYRLNSLKGAK